MPAKIRLKKAGRRGQASYRVVVLDGRKARDAKVVADLGPYDPKTNPPTFDIDGDAALKWLLDGAKPTRAARNILSNAGVMAAWDAAKRGETIAIEAKELKPDEPKKPAAAKAEAEEAPAAAEESSEEPADAAEASDEPEVPEQADEADEAEEADEDTEEAEADDEEDAEKEPADS
jgi:small subunit ribosomal protein S16